MSGMYELLGSLIVVFSTIYHLSTHGDQPFWVPTPNDPKTGKAALFGRPAGKICSCCDGTGMAIGLPGLPGPRIGCPKGSKGPLQTFWFRAQGG